LNESAPLDPPEELWKTLPAITGSRVESETDLLSRRPLANVAQTTIGFTLADKREFLNDVAMQHHHHRHHRWRRYMRNNQQMFFAGFLLIVLLAIVVLLFWLLTSPRFAKFI
jgi:hypothetical protein